MLTGFKYPKYFWWVMLLNFPISFNQVSTIIIIIIVIIIITNIIIIIIIIVIT